ncbi:MULTISPECIES: DUF4286 family protein [Spirosoma]|uniref:DUF4286 domain-containing protein n=1 Tax=Spirosoma linguale (strain ATCC 33905 / DSM 74 / LMG 10896 / Claus 1) TaxID=504472 RepID=D2QKX2_SPILD|nr:DUF4286 family protein [Spirosoma sp.]ADB37211.1 hypothetical protein Slin_1160 [Spirosoma linguale DSM 74]MCX6214946.1 DUF4286 family protein [Spirosoma sp.]
MILYNTTYSVAEEVAEDWLRWMKRFFLPAAMATELPTGYRTLRLLTELDNGGVTFSIQLDFNTRTDYEAYLESHADTLRQRIKHRFGNQFISFDTLLEEA